MPDERISSISKWNAIDVAQKSNYISFVPNINLESVAPHVYTWCNNVKLLLLLFAICSTQLFPYYMDWYVVRS